MRPPTGASVSSRAPGGCVSFSWSHRADTQGEVACLSLGCDRKQEVPVISQDILTLERASKNWQTPKLGWESLAQCEGLLASRRAVGLLKNRAVHTVGMPGHLRTRFLFPSLVVCVYVCVMTCTLLLLVASFHSAGKGLCEW